MISWVDPVGGPGGVDPIVDIDPVVVSDPLVGIYAFDLFYSVSRIDMRLTIG